MDKIDDGGPAFPSNGSMGEVCQEGMSLRDYFAGQALMGLLNNSEARIESDLSDRTNAEILSSNYYFMADAMIAQRSKNGYGMPEFKDKLPAMHILKIIKDSGYSKSNLERKVINCIHGKPQGFECIECMKWSVNGY